MIEKIICSICKKEIVANENGRISTNNASPINDGECCDKCNSFTVIPARMKKANTLRTQK